MGKFGTGLIYVMTGGLGMIGSIYDFFTIPQQVSQANLRLSYEKAVEMNQRRSYQAPASGPVKKESLERIILQVAQSNNGIATPSAVALQGDISIDKAQEQLDKMVSRGYAEIKVRKSGTLAYIFPDFRSEGFDEGEWEEV